MCNLNNLLNINLIQYMFLWMLLVYRCHLYIYIKWHWLKKSLNIFHIHHLLLYMDSWTNIMYMKNYITYHKLYYYKQHNYLDILLHINLNLNKLMVIYILNILKYYLNIFSLFLYNLQKLIYYSTIFYIYQHIFLNHFLMLN